MTRILVVLLSVLSFNTFSQYNWKDLEAIIDKGNTKTLLTHNYKLLEQGVYYQASLISSKLLEKDSLSYNNNFRHGFALLNMSSNYNQAFPYLKYAIDSVVEKFDFFNYREKAAPIDAYYQLARCYHLKGDIKNARKYYQLFISKEKLNTPAYKTAELNLIQCDNAEDARFYKSHVHLEGLGNTVNTKNPEYASIISYDGRSLYFTSRRLRGDSTNATEIDPISGEYLEDVFVSHKQVDGSWSEAELLSFSRVHQNEATVALSLNKKTIYLYDDAQGNGDLYYAPINTNNPFARIKALDIPKVNTEAWEPHIAFTGDGNVAYFSSDRPGGFGGRDIYRIVKYGNGEWSEPVNMGPEINTEWDEDSPFISVDGKTMYFASNGIKSIGGFDIFLTVIDEDNQWSTPINLGAPINSTGDDLYYSTTIDGKVAYITSYRPEGRGEKDIYRIIYDNYIPNNNLFVNGNLLTVNEKPNPDGVLITLQCFDCGADFTIQEMKSTYIDDKYLVELQPDKKYDVIFVDTKTGDIKKQSINTNRTNKENSRVGILLDPEHLEIVQEELDNNIVHITLRSGNDYPLPENITVETNCNNCEKEVEGSKTLNKSNQCLIPLELGKTYTFAFKDENGNVLLQEERTTDTDIFNISDDQFIFTYTKKVPKFFRNKDNFVAGIQLSGLEKDTLYHQQKIQVKVTCKDCIEAQSVLLDLDEYYRTKAQLTPGKTYQYDFVTANGDPLLSEVKTLPIMIDFGKSYLQVFFYNTEQTVSDENNLTKNDTPENIYESFCGLYFNHNFYYNNNRLNENNKALTQFIDSVIAQLEMGRSKIRIKINASASHVPTRAYKSNTQLAEVRAEQIQAYLKTQFKDYINNNRVELHIESAKVRGPKFNRSDLRNLNKYAPYQYVSLQTAAINCESTTRYESIDQRLEDLKVNLKNPPVKHEVLHTQTKSNEAYHVIVYTYNDRKFAEEVIQSTTYKNNNQAQIIEDENGNFLISIANFKTEQEAKNFITRYKYEDKTNAYIFRKK